MRSHRVSGKVTVEENREREQAFEEAFLNDRADIAFGSQVRTYTLQPYTMVKDERTDLAVLKTPPFVAIGSGRKHAYAVMYSLKKAGYGTARERIDLALETSAEFTPSVRGPWLFCTLTN